MVEIDGHRYTGPDVAFMESLLRRLAELEVRLRALEAQLKETRLK